jgi:hypothetical protein
MLADVNIQPINLYGKRLHLIQVPTHQGILHCVLKAYYIMYHLTGEIPYDANTPLEAAVASQKTLYIYDATLVETRVFNKEEGAGAIFVYKDLDGRYWLISQKNRYNEHMTIFDKYSSLVETVDKLVIDDND